MRAVVRKVLKYTRGPAFLRDKRNCGQKDNDDNLPITANREIIGNSGAGRINGEMIKG